jgi:thiamine-monophosphate kinase
MPGEFDLISWIQSQSKPSEFLLVPPGDDLAVLKWEGKIKPPKTDAGPAGRNVDDLLLAGVDQVLEGRHFESSKHTPEQIGRKVVNRNLSDCAAMGCLPAALLVAVALPDHLRSAADGGTGLLDYAKLLYAAIKQTAAAHYCPVIGGDTASWSGSLAVSVTVLGRSAGVAPVTRQGAQPGDGIYVTGPLGGSILGRHLTFEPRLAWGRQLATYRPTGLPCVKAMIDVSDGLSRDLPHLLAAGPQHPQLGAQLDGDKIPLHPDALALSTQSGKPPLHHALHDGEDHELLFTSPVRPPIGIRIGTVTAEPGIRVSGNLLSAGGWEHPL